jgi:hypothetical protein
MAEPEALKKEHVHAIGPAVIEGRRQSAEGASLDRRASPVEDQCKSSHAVRPFL